MDKNNNVVVKETSRKINIVIIVVAVVILVVGAFLIGRFSGQNAKPDLRGFPEMTERPDGERPERPDGPAVQDPAVAPIPTEE
jgi:flagellar basal body-associated protein FliL